MTDWDHPRPPGQESTDAGRLAGRPWAQVLAGTFLAAGLLSCVAALVAVVQDVATPQWSLWAWLAGASFALSWLLQLLAGRDKR